MTLFIRTSVRNVHICVYKNHYNIIIIILVVLGITKISQAPKIVFICKITAEIRLKVNLVAIVLNVYVFPVTVMFC